MSQLSEETLPSPNEAKKILWKKGNLTFKLDANQEQMYHFARNTSHKIVVIACSRQLGKTHFLCTLAIEECVRAPNRVVKLIASETKMIKRIIAPLMRDLLADCPKELRPEYRVADGVYRFPNGSEIQMAGTDGGHAESLRGSRAHLCIVDEAGFCSDLDYIVKSILIPTTTTTRGKIILSSTPPKSNDHDFIRFWDKAEIDGSFIKKTIYDNPRLSIEEIQELAEAIGGITSNGFRREYLCERITDEEEAVVPEFTKDLQLKIIKAWPRPPHYDAYASMDIGFRDLTVTLFAYYDFRQGKIIIEDELVVKGGKFLTNEFAFDIKKKEKSLWITPLTGEFKEPYLRISDNNNLILLNDLQTQHGILFMPIPKDNSDAALNNMRMLLKQERIIINPKCVVLIKHLETAIWNKSRSSYMRSGEQGHFDAVDSLKYLCRGLQMNKNPYPANYQFNDIKQDDVFFSGNNPSDNNKMHESFKQIFKVPKRNKYLK